jgi:hypothetical protein
MIRPAAIRVSVTGSVFTVAYDTAVRHSCFFRRMLRLRNTSIHLSLPVPVSSFEFFLELIREQHRPISRDDYCHLCKICSALNSDDSLLFVQSLVCQDDVSFLIELLLITLSMDLSASILEELIAKQINLVICNSSFAKLPMQKIVEILWKSSEFCALDQILFLGFLKEISHQNRSLALLLDFVEFDCLSRSAVSTISIADLQSHFQLIFCNNSFPIFIRDELRKNANRSSIFAFMSSIRLFAKDKSLCDLFPIQHQPAFSASLSIPEFIEQIEEKAFSGFSGLKEIVFCGTPSISRFCRSSFAHSGLQSLVVPSSVRIIAKKAFCYCCLLTRIEFSNHSSLQTIGTKAFYGSGILSITFPASIKRIQKQAFQDCANLSDVGFYECCRLLYIGGSAFCSSLVREIVFPRNLCEIRPFAFSKCTCLLKLVFFEETSLRRIYEQAFSFCRNIASVRIPNSVQVIDEKAFWQCDQLSQVSFQERPRLVRIGRMAFASTKLSQFVLPVGVEVLEFGTFLGCDFLEAFEVPAHSSLEEIYPEAFSRTIIKNICFPVAFKRLHQSAFSCCSTIECISFCSNESISAKCMAQFAHCRIKKVTVTGEVTQIGQNVFRGVKSLTYLSLEGPAITKIGAFAFAWCSFADLTIPSSVEEICEEAFSRVASLTNVVVPKDSKLKQIGRSAFAGCAFKSFYLPSHLIFVSESGFSNSKLKSLIFSSNSSTDRGITGAFVELAIESVCLCEGVTAVAADAFAKFESLKRVDFPEICSIVKIGDNCFSNTSLNEIRLPISVAEIGDGAFAGCKNLSHLDMVPESKVT